MRVRDFESLPNSEVILLAMRARGYSQSSACCIAEVYIRGLEIMRKELELGVDKKSQPVK